MIYKFKGYISSISLEKGKNYIVKFKYIELKDFENNSYFAKEIKDNDETFSIKPLKSDDEFKANSKFGKLLISAFSNRNEVIITFEDTSSSQYTITKVELTND